MYIYASGDALVAQNESIEESLITWDSIHNIPLNEEIFSKPFTKQCNAHDICTYICHHPKRKYSETSPEYLLLRLRGL